MSGQVLRLNPASELSFRRPFDSVVTTKITLSNPSSEEIFFKVKTTAPKRYCVRPNAGKIEPKGNLEVNVLLQPMKESEAKSKDKFLVQSIVAPEPGMDIEKLWQITEKRDIGEAKLRCVFLPAPGEEGANAGVENIASAANKTSSPLKSSSDKPATPLSSTNNNPSSNSSELNNSTTKAPISTSTSSMNSSQTAAAEGGALEAKEREIADLRRQLAEAKSDGLRQRKVGGGAEQGGATAVAGRAMATKGDDSSGLKLIHLVIAVLLGVLLGYFMHEYIWTK